MPLSVTQKLITAHLNDGSVRAGTPITLTIDQTLTLPTIRRAPVTICVKFRISPYALESRLLIGNLARNSEFLGRAWPRPAPVAPHQPG